MHEAEGRYKENLMTDLRERLNNLKIAVACTLSEPMDEDDLNDILKSIDSIFPEEYISKMERDL